jgi:hypothetical protein
MKRFTIMLGYEGATFVDQNAGATHAKALVAWARRFDPEVAAALAGKRHADAFRKALSAGVARKKTMRLPWLSGVWCVGVPIRRGKKDALIHVIESTAPRRARSGRRS